MMCHEMHNFYKNMDLNKMWLHNMGNTSMKFLWYYSLFILFVIIYFCISLYCHLLVNILFGREALIVILDFLLFYFSRHVLVT